jgi:hypothetical protein
MIFRHHGNGNGRNPADSRTNSGIKQPGPAEFFRHCFEASPADEMREMHAKITHDLGCQKTGLLWEKSRAGLQGFLLQSWATT